MCSGRSEEETEGDRWGHISKAPAQPAPMRQAEAPSSPSQSRERPRLTLAPRSDEASSSQDAPAQPKKKVLTVTYLGMVSVLSVQVLLVLMLFFAILYTPTSAGDARDACLVLCRCIHYTMQDDEIWN